MSKENNYEGKLRLNSYEKLIGELKEETKRFNSKLEEEKLSNFSLKKMKTCSSLVSRTFNPEDVEIIFSLSKEKPPRGHSHFTHLEFRNKLYLNGSKDKPYSETLQNIFNESNQKLLERYKPHKLS